jgi:lipopolysaccharide export system protein LptA
MTKHFLFTLLITFSLSAVYAQGNKPAEVTADSIKLKVEGNNAYYQHTVKVDSGITENKIYLRALEFMAGKNFQQNYGYDEEGKLICTTTQDLNINPFSASGDVDPVDPFTVQFAITVDMKNRRYRYTINNVVFFIPSETGNRRLSLYEVNQMANNTESRRVAKNTQKLISAFESYIGTLTNELYQAIEQKRQMDNTKF